MKKIILALLLPLLTLIVAGQDRETAQKFINDGVAFHDKGDFESAISKYDSALKADNDNLLALAEKSLSLFSLKKYDDAILNCKKAIEKHPSEASLKTVYVTYANALDALRNTDKSLEVYDEGISKFPDYYQLYYNKGVSLTSIKKNDLALLCFQKAITLNTRHASSNNAIGRILFSQDNNIPSLFALCRFLVLEPQSSRAEENLKTLQKILNHNVEQTSENNVTVKINPKILDTPQKGGKNKENSFNSAEMILTMESALDLDKKNADKTEVEQFIRKFGTLCESVDETKKDNFGFYWEYYVPYFLEIKKKNLTETFAYIVFATSGKSDVQQWLNSHKSDIDKFYQWDKSYLFTTK